jgi:hypothetical protein
MMNLLIWRSGYYLRGDSERKVNAEVEAMILALVEHHMSFDDVVAWLELRIAPIGGR